jgi:hypothetical protein
MTNRSDLIVQYFGFLVSEYEFRIEEKEFSPQAMGNAVVVFMSSAVGVEIVVDRDQVLIRMGSKKDQRKLWFEFSDVLKYFAPSIEKAYIFPEKTLENTGDEIVESQIKRLSSILRQHCEPFLKGDLSSKNRIKLFEEKRTAELLEYLNSTPRG